MHIFSGDLRSSSAARHHNDTFFSREPQKEAINEDAACHLQCSK
jgi:hypothetical protein